MWSQKSNAVESFKCEKGHLAPEFSFKGQILENHQLSGPGMLKLYNDINNNDEFKYNDETCFKMPIYKGSTIASIVGNWKNGSLDGNAKVTLKSKEVIVASFRNGLLHGLRRDFDANGTLRYLGYWQDGIMQRKFWQVFNSTHFVLTTIAEEGFPTRALVISKTEGILSGDHYEQFQVLENLNKAKDVKVASDANDCFMDFEWNEGPSLELIGLDLNKPNIIKAEPLFHKQTKPKEIMRTFYNQVRTMSKNQELYHILWSLKANGKQLEPVNHKKCLILIDEVKVDSRLDTLTAILLNSTKKVVFKIQAGTFDENKKLHGPNTLKLIEGLGGQDPTLNWEVIKIEGHWNHGELNGIVSIETANKQQLVGITKKGCLHGPVIIALLVPILPVRSKLYNIQYYYKYILDKH